MDNSKEVILIHVDLPSMPWPSNQVNSNESLTPGEFSLMCAGNLREWAVYTDEFLSLAKDAGFNVIQSVIYNFEAIKGTLPKAQKYGLKFFIRFGNYAQKFNLPNEGNNPSQAELNKILPTNSVWNDTYSHWTTNIGELLDYSAECVAKGEADPLATAVACQLCDEPKICGFWGLTKLAQKLWNLYQSKRPGIKPFLMCNMFPDTTIGDDNNPTNKAIHLNNLSGGLNNASKYVSGYTPITSYSEFVDLYKNMTNPAVLSFDSYPITQKDGVMHANSMEQFFGTLVQYREKKGTLGINFWSTIACCKFVPGKLIGTEFVPNGNPVIPTPTLGHLRFAAFTSILFGASGLTYWGMVETALTADSDGKGYDNPIKMDGSTSATYSLVKQVNKQVQSLKSIFMVKADFGAFVCQHPISPNPGHLIPGLIVLHPSSKIGPLESLILSGEGFVLNLRKDSSSWYLLMVNKNPYSSQTVTLKFSTSAHNIGITGGSTNSSLVFWQGVSSEQLLNGLTVTFEPGDIKVIRYTT